MVFRQNWENEQFGKAKNIAIGWLNKRIASEKQLRTKLRERGVTDDGAIDKAVQLMSNLVQSPQRGTII